MEDKMKQENRNISEGKQHWEEERITKKQKERQKADVKGKMKGGKEYLENLGEGRTEEQKGKVKVRVRDQEKEEKDMRRKGKVV